MTKAPRTRNHRYAGNITVKKRLKLWAGSRGWRMDLVLDCVIGVPIYDPAELYHYANDNARPAQETRYAGHRGERLIRKTEAELLAN